MNKSFLSVSPSEGNGNAQVVVKENVSLDERSESLKIRTSNGVERSVRITQDPGDGDYKTIFEWIFSDGIDNILPQ